ncbi:MAG: TetR/AcrR family transcriptional regulator [Deltaproteobacteria bacterium]|nr:TetR/AcrR family transcriptional regulator [Deltaproteobacteria bacterium]
MSEEASRGAGRPRDPAADEAIIGATLELIAESGFDGLRVSDVADRARVSKATMYRRWPTKHDLVLAALRTAPPLETVDTGSLRGDLEATFAQFMRVVADSPLVSLLTALAAERLRRPQFARELDPYIEERMMPIHAAVERAIARGELPQGTNPVLLSELIGGPILLRLFFGGATDEQAIADLIGSVVDAFGSGS